MKRTARNLVVLVVFAMALTGLSLAQQFDYRVTANIPYDFNVGTQHFAAGNYLFAVNYGDHAVTITNQANRHRSVVLASPIAFASPGYDNRDKDNVVQLSSVGGQYVLSEIETRNAGVTFMGASSGRTMAKQEATVTIAAALQ